MEIKKVLVVSAILAVAFMGLLIVSYAEGQTTTTTTSTTTTAASTTTTTTTTPPAPQVQAFSASNFKCSAKTGGYNCSLPFSNTFNQSVITVFIVTDPSGNTANSIAYTANPGNASANINYYCNSKGNYYVSWEAYLENDTTLKNPVAFSRPLDSQLMAC